MSRGFACLLRIAYAPRLANSWNLPTLSKLSLTITLASPRARLRLPQNRLSSAATC
jgi:hypothetical protein